MDNLDSIDLLVQRRNDIIRLRKRRVEITNRYTKLLQDFGFDDIYVKPGIWYFSNGNQYFDVNGLEVFLWDNTFGYQLEISRSQTRNNVNKCISTDEFILICDKMIEFLSSPTTLRGINIKEQLPLYLESNDYAVVNVSKWLSGENSAWINVGKEDFFFTFRIERVELTQDVLVPFVDDLDADEPINDKFQKFLDDIAKKFDDYIRDTIQTHGWKCTVSTGLREIELSRNGVCHKIRTHSDNLSDPCTEDDVKALIGHILGNEDLLTAFQKDHSHLYMNPNKSNSFFVYKGWSKFEVVIDINTIFEYRELFEKLSKSEWMIDFDQMDGHSFEQFCAKILTENSFESVRVTQGSRDQGVDLVWFSNPEKQNDPYEFNGIYWDEDRLLAAGVQQGSIDNAKELLFHRLCLSAFTSNMSNNLSMWAHYANNHHGYCVKYRVGNKRTFRNVIYGDQRKALTNTFLHFLQQADLGENLGNRDFINEALKDSAILQDKFFYKHISWAYEHEYRALYPFDGTTFGTNVPISELSLTVDTIYSGINCSDGNKEKLAQIASTLGVPCKKCAIHPTDFTVFKEV